MKCRYKYCKNGFEVKKEDAIKEGSSYYCKDCYKEKELKKQITDYYLQNLPTTAVPLLMKVINQLLYTNNYEAEYILYIVKKVHTNGLKINNPFGLTYYCNDGRNITEWKSKKTNIEYQNIKNAIVQNDNVKKVQFMYKPSNKKWTDLI